MHRMVKLCAASKRIPTSDCDEKEYYGVIYLPEGHPLRTGVSTVVQEYFPGASTEKDSASIGKCTVCANDGSGAYAYANRYIRKSKELIDSGMLDSDQTSRLNEIMEKLSAAMINENVDLVKEYSKSLRNLYKSLYDSVY